MLDYLRFGLSALLILSGLFFVAMATIGVYRFKYVLNRMHMAAMGDTLGLSLVLLGLIVAAGFCALSMKLVLVILFFWTAGPVGSHLISRLETTTNEQLCEHVELRDREVHDGNL